MLRTASHRHGVRAMVPEACKKFRDTGPDHLPAWGRSVQPAVQDRAPDRSGRQLCAVRHPDEQADVRVHRDERSYTARQGSRSSPSEIEFPTGNNPRKGQFRPGRMGAIMLKVSYRILDPVKNKDLIRSISHLGRADLFPRWKGRDRNRHQGRPGMRREKARPDRLPCRAQDEICAAMGLDLVRACQQRPDAEEIALTKLAARYSFFNPDAARTARATKSPPRPWDPPTFAAISDHVPEPGRQGQHASAGSAQGSRRLQQVVPRAAQGHRLGKLHAARHAMAERHLQQDRSERRAGPDLSREFHARDLQPGQDPARIVELHGLPRQRRELPVQPLRQDRDGKGFNQSDFTFILEKAQRTP